jgi:hypothetical protein
MEQPQPFTERRRSPRVHTSGLSIVVRPVAMTARVLDISPSGVLLSCPDPLRAGSTPRVSARLSGVTMEASLQVRHASDTWDKEIGGYRVGGKFVSLTDVGRMALEGFLKEAIE